MWLRLTLILLGCLLPIAAAHPTDSLSQSAYITLQPQRFSIELDFTPGELVAPQFVQEFGSDLESLNLERLQQFSRKILELVHFSLDDKPTDLKLEFSQSQIPDLALLKAGGAQLQMVFSGELPSLAGKHRFVFENQYQPVKSAYSANVFVESKDLKIIKQTRDPSLQVFSVDFELPQNANFTPWWILIAAGVLVCGFFLTRAILIRGVRLKGLS
jgi:hypothetical protein